MDVQGESELQYRCSEGWRKRRTWKVCLQPEREGGNLTIIKKKKRGSLEFYNSRQSTRDIMYAFIYEKLS